MKWIKVSDRFPDVNPDGYSDIVLVYYGRRFLPELAQYSPDNTTLLKGTSRKRAFTHWHSNVFCGDSDRNGPLLEPTHWCKITFPKDED